ncbi:MAG: glycosyltransferase [Bacteroidota bacterium]
MADIISPLISVVFTSYNHQKYLKQAVDSILNQTFKDFEFIIIDDCSTDGSRSILEAYQNIPNVRITFLEKNTGSYVKASHYGALQATGKYLLFAQCDDFAENTQLSYLSEKALLYQDTVGVVFSKSNMINDKGEFLGDDYTLRNKSFREKCAADVFLDGKQMRSFLSYACVIPNLSAALIKKDLYFEAGGLPEKYAMAADWAFWLSLSEMTNFYYVTQPLNNFRQHNATIRSKTKIDNQLLEIFTLFTEHIKTYNITGKSRNEMLTGFGNIWFTYFLEAPRSVAASAIKFISKISAKNKFMSYFLLKGALKKIGFIINK